MWYHLDNLEKSQKKNEGQKKLMEMEGVLHRNDKINETTKRVNDHSEQINKLIDKVDTQMGPTLNISFLITPFIIYLDHFKLNAFPTMHKCKPVRCPNSWIHLLCIKRIWPGYMALPIIYPSLDKNLDLCNI